MYFSLYEGSCIFISPWLPNSMSLFGLMSLPLCKGPLPVPGYIQSFSMHACQDSCEAGGHPLLFHLLSRFGGRVGRTQAAVVPAEFIPAVLSVSCVIDSQPLPGWVGLLKTHWDENSRGRISILRDSVWFLLQAHGMPETLGYHCGGRSCKMGDQGLPRDLCSAHFISF